MTTFTIAFDVLIHAPVDKVWRDLTEHISQWWSADFYTSSKTQSFILEPVVGGRMYEDYGNGNGLLWAQEIVVDAPQLIEMKGHLSPQFGGPAITFMRIQLKDQKNQTLFKLSDTTMGDVTEKTKAQLEEGWKLIFGEAFKKYVESPH